MTDAKEKKRLGREEVTRRNLTVPNHDWGDYQQITGRDEKPHIRTDWRTNKAARDVAKLLPGLTKEVVSPKTKAVKPICSNCGITGRSVVDPDTLLCLDTGQCARRARNWR